MVITLYWSFIIDLERSSSQMKVMTWESPSYNRVRPKISLLKNNEFLKNAVDKHEMI